jgi:medium-chain acyl-[acyl-carrier-protein] hydrolase
LVAASTVWAILDKEKGQPQRMDIFDCCFSPQDRNALEAKPMKIGPVKLPETLPEPMDVRHSDIDINQHVNNAHYIQWAFAAVSDAFRKTHKITDVAVKFIAQAKLGDQYIVCSEPVSENCFNTAIFSADSNTEYCRLQTEWEAVSMS